MDNRFTEHGPAFRRRRRTVRGIGSISFLVIVLGAAAAASGSATFLRDPMNELLQSWFGLDLHKVADAPPPATMELH